MADGDGRVETLRSYYPGILNARDAAQLKHAFAGNSVLSAEPSPFHEDLCNHSGTAYPNNIIGAWSTKPSNDWASNINPTTRLCSIKQTMVNIRATPVVRCNLPSGFTGLPRVCSSTMASDTRNPDYLATAVNAEYTSQRFRPPTGQYTILAGFILVSPERHQVISLATGSKCLPANRLSERGESVNDSHAEVLARRGALLWFLGEVRRMRNCASGETSFWIEKHPFGEYRLRDAVRIHMYISTVPCTSTKFVVATAY